MRVTLAELAPVRLEPAANLRTIDRVVGAGPADLVVFPELFLTGYTMGDEVHALALGEGHPLVEGLAAVARRHQRAFVVGAPWRGTGREGECWNAALLVAPDAPVRVQAKRFLPTFGPFEEGRSFAPGGASEALALGPARIGFQICYDAFFPEVSRSLAEGGATLLVALSAAPVTSRRLFDKVLPARAIENTLPVVYVNRVGVEDGLVFGGGSIALDARGEAISGEPLPLGGLGPDERVESVEVDLAEAGRWRPFRPVLRDLAAAARPGYSRGTGPEGPASGRPDGRARRARRARRTDPL
jgi:predicted amidohydrolase